MAAQVEVQTGEVGRTIAGGRLHLSPLTDSSNKSLIEIPSINQSHIITPEPNKPVPGPKPRLTPKPFAVERNPTIKPILAPKPQTKPRPESTRLVGYNPELSCSPKPQEPFASGKPRSVSANPSRPSPTSFKTYNKSNTGQTTKPIVQSFKTAPPLDPAEPKPIQTVTSSLVYSKSLKQLPAAEWSGITQNQNEKDQMASSKGGAFITRAKSMGFLVQVGQEEEESEKANPKVAVPLRPQPRGTRPRPVSAIFLESPTKAETPVPAPRWARRPLSADLTAKFESIGLSLHRQTPKGNSKENNPEENLHSQKSEQEKTPKSTTITDGVAQPAVSDQSNKKTEEIMTVKETDEDKRAVSIKSRISLLLDSSPSPGTGVTGQGSDFHSPGQAIPDTETPVGVKHLIKQLTEDTIPTQNTVVKPALKPRPLPLDLTKRFSAERSPDLGSVSLSEETDRLEISKDPQRRIEESTITPNDQRTFLDLKDSQKQLKKSSTPEGHEVGQMFGATPKESGARSDVQTVRASLFENVVERHSVLMVEEGKPVKKANDLLSSPSFKRGNVEEEGTLVTATYKEPVSPSNPLRVSHAFDTVQAVEESKAVSEKIPSAQLEDKAMTLRSRHSEGSRVVAERTASAQGQPASAMMSEQQPRYLRVGALHKWTSSGLDQKTSVEKGMLKESQRDGQVTLNQDRDRLREAEQEEVAAAPKRLKMLQAEEQPRPRATYFALTGQIQEPVSPVDAGASIGDMSGPYDDFSVRSVLGSSQGKLIPIKRDPSLDGAFGKNSRDQVEELMMRYHVSPREITSTLDGQTTAEIMDVEKKRELKKENERHMSKMKELEREKQRQLEIEKEAHLQFAQMKEREMQREFERQRQKSFKKEKLEFDEKQRALERQKRLELEQKQKLQELETVRLQEVEKERQLQLEKEKHQKLERRRKIEREKLQEQEREREREQDRQRQREEERQRELDREIQLLEIQKEKRKMEELERIKAMERLQLLEFQKQKEKERERQQLMELEKQRLGEKMGREEAEKIKRVALEQEMLRMKEIEKERQREKEHHKAIEREKQRELERQRHRDLERERQRQLDIEKQELESQRLRQRELDKERQRKEELERIIEMERRQLLELEKQKQAERDRQQMFELENRSQRERIEREEAEKMRQIAKQQEAARQRLKERQKKEEQERARLESSLRPQVVDLDAVLRNDPVSKAPSQRSDPATRWKEPSPRAEESYKPAILDIDSFTSQVQLSPSKDFFPDSGFPGVDAAYGARLQPAPAEEVSWRLPQQTSVSFTSPVWTTSPQDPWELQPVEMSVDKPMAESRKHGSKLSPDQLRQEERLLAPQRHWSVVLGEPLPLTTLSQTEVKSSASEENVWLPREPQDSRGEVRSHRRSQGSQEINRMRSRSVSRRSAPPCSAVDGGFSRVRSRSAHREQDHDSEVQQKQSVRGEEEGTDSGSPVRDTDSQYGTWETGLRSDESLTPPTPSSESNLSSSPRKPSPPHTPGDPASLFDSVDSLPPSSSSSESQPRSFPDAPTTLLDTRALRSRAQLGKKRAPRTRPSRAARQTALLSEEGTPEDWLYRDSTEARVESKANDSDSEEQARGGDSAVSSQPPRVALFPGMDPSALKAQLKKRGDSDNLIDAPTPSPSQLCLSPKSPFLPRAARVLPPPGGKENGEEDSPQWLKELKSKKRLSQYENDS